MKSCRKRNTERAVYNPANYGSTLERGRDRHHKESSSGLQFISALRKMDSRTSRSSHLLDQKKINAEIKQKYRQWRNHSDDWEGTLDFAKAIICEEGRIVASEHQAKSSGTQRAWHSREVIEKPSSPLRAEELWREKKVITFSQWADLDRQIQAKELEEKRYRYKVRVEAAKERRRQCKAAVEEWLEKCPEKIPSEYKKNFDREVEKINMPRDPALMRRRPWREPTTSAAPWPAPAASPQKKKVEWHPSKTKQLSHGEWTKKKAKEHKLQQKIDQITEGLLRKHRDNQFQERLEALKAGKHPAPKLAYTYVSRLT